MSRLTGVEIRPYTEKDYPNITKYSLPEEQAIYTSLPIAVIEAFQMDANNLPFVIYSGDDLVGCFALYTDQSGNVYTSNASALLFKSLSIDSRFQNRGYALQSLKSLTEMAKRLFPDKNEIILTVHHTNTPAITLYVKAGFMDKGLRFAGEYGEELIFHYALE
ncbi:GNAT family N-acetyltransferase [Brevibacillus sp. NRS-1366]|uniref:GNAT family N-acetyltransferase n=1 Tax=Brevibacillus sp. NRS-1366 TaxID=3233899 RepID=UPI003D1AB80B